MANQIRNIAQTVQEREIIKTCPDVVVYVEGRPYLINPYINTKDDKNQTNGLYTVVNFNDYVDSFSASYDVDSLIPSGSFSLTVPEHQKYLFQAPGGNNILETMMQVQVFAKGYFPSKDGNTLYYRVFKGLISNVTHTDTGTALQISVGLIGTLHFLDLMYVDLAPAILRNSPSGPVPMQTNTFKMNPYQALADTFLRAVTPAGFQLNSIQQDALDGKSDWSEAVSARYINRWQFILTNIMRDVRILGYDLGAVEKFDPQTLPSTYTNAPDDAAGKMTPSARTSKNSQMPNMSIAEQVADKDFYVTVMRKYLPDQQVGQIALLNGKIISRLERIRTLVNLIAYEGYQDLDGAIIFKPPFYNLDVTDGNLGMAASTGSTGSGTSGATSAASYIRKGANPFVVYLSEIESESETEDEGGIRATRMTIQPDWLPDYHFGSSNTILPVAEHIDMPKLSKFGLREQPARQLPFLGEGDKFAMYTYAVSELNRANRSYRTYSLTIPIRPELRLGFPMYIPHRDMYGYIKTIGISYQQAGAATMHVVLDTIRKRPLLPGNSTITDPQGIKRDIVTYSSQPNLVMQWTTAPSSKTPASGGATGTTTPTQPSSHTMPGSASGATSSGTSSTNNLVDLKGNPATLPQPSTSPFYPEEWEYIIHQKEKLGSLFAVRFDTKTKSFRVQNDAASPDDVAIPTAKESGVVAGKPFFSSLIWLQQGITAAYFQKILTTQPYTDEKGYELVTPFPWGRWIDVNTAIRESRLGILSGISTQVQQAGTVQGVDVFLFAGLAAPPSSGMSDDLSKALNSKFTQSINGTKTSGFDSVELDSVVELITPQPGDVGNDPYLTNASQPDMQQQPQVSSLNDIESRLGVFVTGGTSLPDKQTLKGVETKPQVSPTKPIIPSLSAIFDSGSNE